jgi:DNA repair photolyase
MGNRYWEKATIHLGKNEPVEAVAPLIISASRATDIPAFYSNWLINRMREGYVKWINPFNGRPQFVSFEKARVIVFWTKNPAPFMDKLKVIDGLGLHCYFHFTLNDYGEEGFEPNLPPLTERFETFKRLSSTIGKDRVVWRFDPLILTEDGGTEKLLDKISRVGKEVHPFTERLVFSFARIDEYRRVRGNLKRAGVAHRNFGEKEIYRIANGLRKLNEAWGLELAACAEEVDLGRYGIDRSRCIDDRLMRRLFPGDVPLMEFLGGGGKDNGRLCSDSVEPVTGKLKDRGQRKNCGCIVSKDIGHYSTCGHLCVYCYANQSKDLVLKNLARHGDGKGDSIVKNP